MADETKLEETQGTTDEERQAAHDHQMLAAIKEAEARVASCERDWETAKAEAKCAKDAFDAAVKRLRDVIRTADEPMLPFGEQDSQGWRSRSLGELGLPASIVTLLAEAKLETIGGLAEYSEAGNQVSDVNGIGESKAKVVEDALMKFWSDNPQYVQGGETCDESEDGDDDAS